MRGAFSRTTNRGRLIMAPHGAPREPPEYNTSDENQARLVMVHYMPYEGLNLANHISRKLGVFNRKL